MAFNQKNEKEKEKNKHPTILKIPDELWNELKSIFPKEKQLKTVGGRPIISYRKVINGIIHVLRTEDASGKCYQKNTDWAIPVTVGFSNGITLISCIRKNVIQAIKTILMFVLDKCHLYIIYLISVFVHLRKFYR